MTPLSTAIRTRGKFVEGNTDTGIVKARYAPRRPRVRMRKMTGLECRAIQWSAFGWFTQLLRPDYFSLFVLTWSLGAFTLGTLTLGTLGRGFCWGSFDFNLGVVRQAVGPSRNYLVCLCDPIENLHIVALTNAEFDGFLVGLAIRASQHYY